MQQTAMTAVQPARVEALRARHSALAEKIEQEQLSPAASDWYIKDLKRQKLFLKEEIEGIRE